MEAFINDVNGPGAWAKLSEAERQIYRDNAWIVKGMEEEKRRPMRCEDFASLGKPVLLTGGDRSPARYGEILNVIEPCFKQVTRITIPNASHGMHLMNPAAFNSAVLQFLHQAE